MTTVTTMNIAEFKQAVERHWRYHAPCRTLMWNVQQADDEWQIEVAPPFQEVVGGEQDGMKVWAGFRFDVSGFMAERGVLVENVLAASYCTQCTETPYIGIRGTFFGHPFDLKVHLEPVGGDPVEIIDSIRNEVRDIKEKQT